MPAVPASQIPTSELGRVSGWATFGASGWPDDTTEEVPDLTWPLSVTTYNRMGKDSQIASMLWAVTLPLRNPIWSVDPRLAREEVVARFAEDIDLPIKDGPPRPPLTRSRGRFSWTEHLRLALLAGKFGHMAFEQVYAIRDGFAHLRKLAPRFPNTLTRIDVAEDGGLKGAWQPKPDGRGTNGRPEQFIPVERLVWYSLDREGAAWQGTSLLRPCYKDWVLMDRLLRVRAMTIERNGMGVPIGIGSESDNQAELDELSALAQGYRAGEYSGGALKHGQDLRFKGVEGSLPNATEAIRDHRDQIAKRFGAQFTSLGTGDNTGNRALGEVFLRTFSRNVDAIGEQLSDIATQHIAEDWVDINYGPDEPAPAIVARPVDAEVDIPPEALVALIQARAIEPDDVLEAWIRTRYRLPEKGIPRPRPEPVGIPA